MKVIAKTLCETDLHQIEGRFAHARIQKPKEVAKMAHALAEEGQRIPLIALKEGEKRVLLDGYLRLAAARQCGWDTIWVETWDCDLETGMSQILGLNRGRRWDAVEEGYLIEALVSEGLSKQAIAQRLGHQVS